MLVTGYVINYLTADCHMPNRKECSLQSASQATRKANGRVILTPWANACWEFLNRPKPFIVMLVIRCFL